jgi:predicted nuclease with TOPRIM domain
MMSLLVGKTTRPVRPKVAYPGASDVDRPASLDIDKLLTNTGKVCMGLLTDILKEIPQAAVLKEKIADIEAKYAAADTENAILKDDLRKANAEIAKLKKQVEELTHKDGLDETESGILTLLADGQLTHNSLRNVLELPEERLSYYLRRLMDDKYIRSGPETSSRQRRFTLDQKGREYLIKVGKL